MDGRLGAASALSTGASSATCDMAGMSREMVEQSVRLRCPQSMLDGVVTCRCYVDMVSASRCKEQHNKSLVSQPAQATIVWADDETKGGVRAGQDGFSGWVWR